MPQTPDDAPEVEIICPQCSYHMPRTAYRLRRETEIVCPNCGAVILPADDADGAREPEN